MAENKQSQKIKQILSDLNSDDTKKISKAIKALESNGNSTVIKPLANRLLTDIPAANKQEIIELLSSLKDSSVCPEIMDVLSESEYKPIRQLILSTIWNTKVDFSDYIDEFVQIAAEGDLMEAVECSTIIDHLEGPFMEENILECQLHLKNYLESDGAKDEHKAYIMSLIAIRIKDINESLED